MTTIYLDASALAGWSNCREFYRRQQMEKIEPVKPSTYYHFGKATHLMVESFWRGESYEKALAAAYDCLNEYPVAMLNPPELETWERMVKGTPDITAAYFDAVSYSLEQLLWVEKEWSIPYADHDRSEGTGSTDDHQDDDVRSSLRAGSSMVRSNVPEKTKVILCGRMDRLMAGPRLVDVKTASEISQQGVPWKQQYRQDKVLDLQFALYDYYLQRLCKCGHDVAMHDDPLHHKQLGIDPVKPYSLDSCCCYEAGCECGVFHSMAPIEIYLEVLLKPYKSKAARYERIDLNELITESYRKRFRQQLKWKVSEIVHYVENYSQQKPWPMSGGHSCSNKFGHCSYIDLCSWGDSEKSLKKFQHRESHLELVRIAETK